MWWIIFDNKQHIKSNSSGAEHTFQLDYADHSTKNMWLKWGKIHLPSQSEWRSRLSAVQFRKKALGRQCRALLTKRWHTLQRDSGCVRKLPTNLINSVHTCRRWPTRTNQRIHSIQRRWSVHPKTVHQSGTFYHAELSDYARINLQLSYTAPYQPPWHYVFESVQKYLRSEKHITKSGRNYLKSITPSTWITIYLRRKSILIRAYSPLSAIIPSSGEHAEGYGGLLHVRKHRPLTQYRYFCLCKVAGHQRFQPVFQRKHPILILFVHTKQ